MQVWHEISVQCNGRSRSRRLGRRLELEPCDLAARACGAAVVTAPIPLTSLSDDAAALGRVLARTSGPVLLARAMLTPAPVRNCRGRRRAGSKGWRTSRPLAPDEGGDGGPSVLQGRAARVGAQVGSRCRRFIWMPDDGFAQRLRASRHGRTTRAGQSGAAPDLGQLHSTTGRETAVEVAAGVVSDRGRGSHDQSADATLHGRANEGHGPIDRRRSYTRSSPRPTKSCNSCCQPRNRVLPEGPRRASTGERHHAVRAIDHFADFNIGRLGTIDGGKYDGGGLSCISSR